MTRTTYDIQGFTVVLDQIVMISAIFEADNKEGWQFNVRMTGDVRLAIKRPTREDATMERQRLVQALNGRSEGSD